MRNLTTVLLTLACCLMMAVPVTAQENGAAAKYSQSYELEGRGEHTKALSMLESLPKDKRSGYVYHLRRGWLQYLSGKHDESVSSYKKATSAAPNAVEPKLGLMLPQMALRKWKDAVATGRAALKLDARNYLASSRLAWSLYNLGRYDEAEKYYRQMHELYPADVEMTAGLAWALLKQGDKSAAAKLFEQVLDVAPNHVSSLQGVREAK